MAITRQSSRLIHGVGILYGCGVGVYVGKGRSRTSVARRGSVHKQRGLPRRHGRSLAGPLEHLCKQVHSRANRGTRALEALLGGVGKAFCDGGISRACAVLRRSRGAVVIEHKHWQRRLSVHGGLTFWRLLCAQGSGRSIEATVRRQWLETQLLVEV